MHRVTHQNCGKESEAPRMQHAKLSERFVLGISAGSFFVFSALAVHDGRVAGRGWEARSVDWAAGAPAGSSWVEMSLIDKSGRYLFFRFFHGLESVCLWLTTWNGGWSWNPDTLQPGNTRCLRRTEAGSSRWLLSSLAQERRNKFRPGDFRRTYFHDRGDQSWTSCALSGFLVSHCWLQAPGDPPQCMSIAIGTETLGVDTGNQPTTSWKYYGILQGIRCISKIAETSARFWPSEAGKPPQMDPNGSK